MNPGIVGYGENLWEPAKLHLIEFPDRINVLFEERFRKKFIDEAIRETGSFRKLAASLVNPYTHKTLRHKTVLDWYRGKGWNGIREYDNYMPVWAVKKLYEITDFNYSELDVNVVAYRGRSGLSVRNPIL